MLLVCIFSSVDIDGLEHILNCFFTEDDFLKVFEVPFSGCKLVVDSDKVIPVDYRMGHLKENDTSQLLNLLIPQPK